MPSCHVKDFPRCLHLKKWVHQDQTETNKKINKKVRIKEEKNNSRLLDFPLYGDVFSLAFLNPDPKSELTSLKHNNAIMNSINIPRELFFVVQVK